MEALRERGSEYGPDSLNAKIGATMFG